MTLNALEKTEKTDVDLRILDKLGDEQAYREAIREWLDDVKRRFATLKAESDPSYYDTQQWWMAERSKVGLATPHWPKEYGGVDLSLENQVILAEEMARGDAPPMGMFVVSLNHIPHTLMAWGTEEQKKKYLPQVAKGQVWCQGFSEPGAGSDLASLRTRAVRDGDHYVVNGQKIWSSMSMWASHCILLARTDPDAQKHAGISYFLMDMKAPGVEVRPIKQSNTESEFAELFLTDVRIPASEMVGAEGQGWKVSQSTLSAERGVLSFEGGERLRYEVERFLASAVREDAAWLRDAGMRREFMRLFGEVQACRRFYRKLLKETREHSPMLAATVPQIKIINTVLRKEYSAFATRAQGLEGQFMVEEKLVRGVEGSQPLFNYISSFAGTIAGGSNEIMRNILSERILGMPKG